MPRDCRLPDFIVVGSMKCGTTSLHHYLSLHPQLAVSRPQELCFFVGGPSREENDPPWGNWWRGEAWYRSHFVTAKQACGEVSPGYVSARHGRVVVERMRETVPNARLVLLVREPMERLRSHFLMERREPDTGPVTFLEFVTESRFADAVAYSDYGSQIGRILDRFPRESLLVVESADLDRRREETLGRIFAFLGVDADFRSPAFARRLFEGSNRAFPGALGSRILGSRVMRASERHLPFTLHEAVRNVVLAPFSVPEPDLALPPAVESDLRERFRLEAALARRRSGLALPSLGA